ncbi:MAG: ABC transporter ATP-binding protein, partial [Firmicutes bacterium]|nr:ABC transporter ATP-binding protein [Bacillota bacterium]
MKKKNSHAQLLWRLLKGSRLLFLCSVLCSAVSNLMDMLNPQIIRAAIDNAIGGMPSTFPPYVNALVEKVGGFSYLGQHLWLMAAALLVVAAIRAGAHYLTMVLNSKASETLVKNMRDSLFSHIERLPFAWHQKNHTGDIIQRCTTDVDRLRAFVAEQLTSVFRISVYLIFALYFMFSMNVQLGLVALLPIPFMLAYS